MPHRSKHEAQIKMNIGVARVHMQQGLTPREGLEAMRKHFENVAALEKSHVDQPIEAEEQVNACRR